MSDGVIRTAVGVWFEIFKQVTRLIARVEKQQPKNAVLCTCDGVAGSVCFELSKNCFHDIRSLIARVEKRKPKNCRPCT